MENKNAEIITIGEEYASRRDACTGADVIAKMLSDVGVSQKSRYYVDTDEEEIFAAVSESVDRYEMTFITGNFVGFSPLSTRAVSRLLGVDPVNDMSLFSCMNSYAKKHDIVLNDSIQKYAMLPRGASALICDSVPLSGFIIERDGKTIVSLPGSPEFISLICEECLADRFKNLIDDRPAERRLDFIGCKVAQVVAEAERIEGKYPGVSAKVFQPTAEFVLSVSVPGAGVSRAEELMEKAVADVVSGPLSEYYYGADTDLPTEVVRRLAENKETLSTAESCTGGLIAKLITDVPGASEVFPGSIVSYSNEIKKTFLGVDEVILRDYGAVSHRVAVQMAEGVRRRMNTNWGIGVTGIAGPGGGTPDKPVGLVYIAIASKSRTRVLKFNVDGSRDDVRNTVAKYALRELLVRIISRERRKAQEEE